MDVSRRFTVLPIKLLIGLNIVIDGFGTASFMAGIGFFTLWWGAVDPAGLLLGMGIGGFAGIGASFIAASLTDTFGRRRLLLIVQSLQLIVYAGLLLPVSSMWIVLFCSLGTGLGRVVSPVRGALPPMYLDKNDLIGFKAKVKTWTIVATVSGGLIAAVIGSTGDGPLLLFIPGVNCVSFFIVLGLTLMLPVEAERISKVKPSLYRPSKAVLSVASLFALLFAVGSIPENVIAILAADRHGIPSSIVVASSVIGFLVAILGQYLISGREDRLRQYHSILTGASLLAGVLSIGALIVVVHVNMSPLWAVVLIVVAGFLSESALLITLYAMWDLQYSLGDDKHRGGVIGVFSVASSLGVAGSPALASALFFSDMEIALPVGLVVIVGAVLLSGVRVRQISYSS